MAFFVGEYLAWQEYFRLPYSAAKSDFIRYAAGNLVNSVESQDAASYT